MKFTQTPPDGRHHRHRRVLVHDYWKVADECRQHPGEWALAFENAPFAIANAIRRGVRALPKDEFEMKTSNNTQSPPRTCDIWIKYKKPRKPQPTS